MVNFLFWRLAFLIQEMSNFDFVAGYLLLRSKGFCCSFRSWFSSVSSFIVSFFAFVCGP